MEDKLYWYWLCGKVLLPIKKQKELMDIFIHPKELYKINPEILKEHMTQLEYDRFVHSRDETAIKKGYEALHRENIRFIIQKEAAYPNRLRKIYDAPYGIFQKGQPYEEKELSIAIVGSRYPTTYGFEISKKFAKELAQQGVQIVSGLARGVDGTVHREIIDKKGQAVGVLGCGIDLIYPKENFQLFYDMYANQTVISEYPPGSEPLKWHFPERNRIISGLSDGILVTEARARSGSLITADFALEQGRDVYAIPGRITDALSAGCNSLIRQGAGAVSDLESFVQELAPDPGAGGETCTFEKLLLEKEERLVYSCVDLRPKSMEELLEETDLSVPELAQILGILLKKGFVTEAFKNCYIRRI